MAQLPQILSLKRGNHHDTTLKTGNTTRTAPTAPNFAPATQRCQRFTQGHHSANLITILSEVAT
jgi:hypothetical protein